MAVHRAMALGIAEATVPHPRDSIGQRTTWIVHHPAPQRIQEAYKAKIRKGLTWVLLRFESLECESKGVGMRANRRTHEWK